MAVGMRDRRGALPRETRERTGAPAVAERDGRRSTEWTEERPRADRRGAPYLNERGPQRWPGAGPWWSVPEPATACQRERRRRYTGSC